MLPENLDRLRLSGPAFAGLEEICSPPADGHYSDDIQAWVHNGSPSALSSHSHLKSDSKEGSED
jgi:hypothetical protein